jgi:hypothetical protein
MIRDSSALILCREDGERAASFKQYLRENSHAIELHRDSMVGANDWRETNGN